MKVTKAKIRQILKEELTRIKEASMSRGFSKAVEAYQDVQLKQQKLRKAFVAEKDPAKREKLKQALLKMHKLVKKAEEDFNKALMQEPVDLDEKLVFYFDKKKDKIMRFDTDRSKNKKFRK
tara:strand:- start:17 stop:379 length:363 start_codon:yes stop_codon:yes gene_type:complete